MTNHWQHLVGFFNLPGAVLRGAVVGTAKALGEFFLCQPLVSLVERVESNKLSLDEARRLIASAELRDVFTEDILELSETLVSRESMKSKRLLIADLLANAADAHGSPMRRLNSWSVVGALAFDQSQLEPARHAFRQAILAAASIGRGDIEGRLRIQLGAVEFLLGDLTDAENSFSAALKLLDGEAALPELAQTWSGLGGVALQQGNAEQARVRWERACEVAGQLEPLDNARWRLTVADNFHSLGDTRRSWELVQTALRLLAEKNSPELVAWAKSQSQVLDREAGRRHSAQKEIADLASLDSIAPRELLATGSFSEILGSWHHRTKIEYRHRQVELLRHPQSLEARQQLVSAIIELGLAFGELQDTTSCERCFEDAWENSAGLGPTIRTALMVTWNASSLQSEDPELASQRIAERGESADMSPYLATMMPLYRGLALHQQKIWDAAITQLSLGLAEATRTQLNNIAAMYHAVLSETYRAKQYWDEALFHGEAAVSLNESLGNVEQVGQWKLLVSKALLGRGRSRWEAELWQESAGDVALAWNAGRAALRCATRTGHVPSLRDALTLIGQCEESLGLLSEDETLPNSARRIRELQQRTRGWQHRSLRAFSWAIGCHERQVAGAPDLFTTTSGLSYRTKLQEETSTLFERAAGAAIRLGKTELALRFVEKWKCALLAEQILSVPQATALPSRLTELKTLDLELNEAVLSYGQVIIGGDSRLIALVKLPGSIHSFECDAVRLAEVMKHWETLIAGGTGPAQVGRQLPARTTWNAVLMRLHELLLPTELKKLLLTNRVRRLIVLPYADVHAVPFAALVDPDTSEHLIDHWEVVVAPNAVIWSECRRRRKERSLRRHPERRMFVGLTNPSPQASRPMPDLQRAEGLLRDWAKSFPGSRILTGSEATPSRFLRAARGADIVHVTVHGDRTTAPADSSSLNSAHSAEPHRRPALILSPEDPSGDPSLNALTDRAIIEEEPWGQLFGQCGLFAMNSCDVLRPGYRDQNRTGEIDGLPTALMIQGVPTIVGSLWTTWLDVSQVFFDEFYRRVGTELEPVSVAFRESLQHLRCQTGPNGESYDHPQLWGGFSLMGDVGD